MTSSTPTKSVNKHIAEVIFSTNEMIIAQCYKEVLSDKTSKQSILQGSTVKVTSSYDSSYVAYGLITKINNTSLDNIHKPSALGLTSNELEYLQPQVYDLLRKELEIYLFAHEEQKGNILNYPPLKPMMIHDFVSETTFDEVLKLTEDFSSLINLIRKHQFKSDILVNLIIQGYLLRNNDNNYLIKAGQELSKAFSDELESLIPVLKRLQESKVRKK